MAELAAAAADWHGSAMHTVLIEEAAAHLPELIAEACRGAEVVIAQADAPAVRLTPIPPESPGAAEMTQGRPLFGSLKGKIKMAPDFDEPLADFRPYMESPTEFIVRELAALAAKRILEMPARVQEGIERLARWRSRTAGCGRDAAFSEWEEIIRSRTPAEIAGLLVDEGSEAKRLRSSMPFIRPPFFTEEERQGIIARAFKS